MVSDYFFESKAINTFEKTKNYNKQNDIGCTSGTCHSEARDMKSNDSI